MLQVHALSLGPANYSFNISPVVNDAVIDIDLNELVNGTIQSAGRVNRYQFTLDEQTRFYLDNLTLSNGLTVRIDGLGGQILGTQSLQFAPDSLLTLTQAPTR